MAGNLMANKVAPMGFQTTRAKNTPYDIILGLDMITELKMSFDFANQTICWDDSKMEMKSCGTLADPAILEHIYNSTQNSSTFNEAEEQQGQILDANYSKIDTKQFVSKLDYLDSNQKDQLADMLDSFPTLFGGGLSKLNIEWIHLELKEGTKPYHAKPFSLPKACETTTKKEIPRFEELGIWKRTRKNAWTAGTFIQPKKTGNVHILTDFCRLNKYIVRRPHPLTKIKELLQKLEGFKYAMAIDLSMGYYHIPLDKHSQQLCRTVMLWGLYKYTVLPMGICNAGDAITSLVLM